MQESLKVIQQTRSTETDLSQGAADENASLREGSAVGSQHQHAPTVMLPAHRHSGGNPESAHSASTRHAGAGNRHGAASNHQTLRMDGGLSPNSIALRDEAQDVTKNSLAESECNVYLTARAAAEPRGGKRGARPGRSPAKLQVPLAHTLRHGMFKSQRAAFGAPPQGRSPLLVQEHWQPNPQGLGDPEAVESSAAPSQAQGVCLNNTAKGHRRLQRIYREKLAADMERGLSKAMGAPAQNEPALSQGSSEPGALSLPPNPPPHVRQAAAPSKIVGFIAAKLPHCLAAQAAGAASVDSGQSLQAISLTRQYRELEQATSSAGISVPEVFRATLDLASAASLGLAGLPNAL